MAYILREKLESRDVSKTKDGIVATLVHIVESDTEADFQTILDPTAVMLASPAVLPSIGSPHPTIPFVTLKSIEMTVNPGTTNRGVVTLNYGYLEQGNGDGGGKGKSTANANNEIWQFSMMSQSTTITSAKSDELGKPQQVTYNNANIFGARLYSAINFDNDSVYGVDVYRPTGTVNVSKFYPNLGDVNQSYRKTIRSLQNTVNDARWPDNSEFSRGELLFLGADISYNITEGSATVNYSFQTGNTQKNQKFQVWAKNKTEVVTVEVPLLYPFQQIWAPLERNMVKEGGDKSKPAYNLGSVNVADVYEYGDFTQLLITGD